ncbi:MAG: HAMP domain-containing histidine kinase, partial [Eubacterium sp.]|nr:HAMP domain-containing histidine kinase [Eubacterium sp.]
MIKKLQRKFIFSAMLAITILLVFLLGALNIENAHMSRKQNEQVIDTLLSNENLKPLSHMDKEPRGFLSAPIDENAKFSTVYFTVRTDDAENIISTDVSRIASVSEKDAEEIFIKITEKNSNEGKIQNFRYKSTVNMHDNTKIYLFIDTTMQTNNVLRVLILSALIGFACWIAMLILIILLSKKAIRPVAENIERQKQFVTDAGHEIKTPLAIILSNTEAMELYNGESKWSKNIKEQANRLNGLMQNLLTLAKSDEKSIADIKETVSVSEITEKVTNMFTENAELKNICIEKNIEQDITFLINKELFSRLISILMDNAVKYSKENEKIEVLLNRNEKHIHLEISNTCEDLPQCPANRLFDRFYRADSARTQKNGGYGIG